MKKLVLGAALLFATVAVNADQETYTAILGKINELTTIAIEDQEAAKNNVVDLIRSLTETGTLTTEEAEMLLHEIAMLTI